MQQATQRDGQLLIRFRDNVSEQEKTTLVESKGGRRARTLRGESHVEVIELQPSQDPITVATELKFHPEVEVAEPNFLITVAQVTPSDARFGEQWALSNTGQTDRQPGADINARAAWATTTGSPTTIIAVIDSGIDFTHPELRDNQWINVRRAATSWTMTATAWLMTCTAGIG